jgi:sulfoquinovosidase
VVPTLLRAAKARPHVLVLLLALGIAACPSNPAPAPATPDAAPPLQPIVLQTATMTVTVGAPQFSILVQSPSGQTLLSSATGTDEYAAFSATHRAVVFEPHVIQGWDYELPTDAPAAVITNVVSATSTGSSATLSLADSTGTNLATVTIAINGTELRMDASVTGPSTPDASGDQAPPGLDLVSMAFQLSGDEHFFGLGERYVTEDQLGQTFDDWVQEGGVAGGASMPIGPSNPSPNGPGMTYSPIPFFLSTYGYAGFLDSTYRTGTSFGGEQSGAWRLWDFEPALHVSFFVNADPKDSITEFTAKTGRANVPPTWAFGNRRRVDVNNVVMGVPEVELMRQMNVPCTGVDDATHFLPIDSEAGQESTLDAWTADLHSLGYKAFAYYNPFVSTTNPAAAADLGVGRSNGYFVKLQDGSEFDTLVISAGAQTVATIDMTNPAAVTWYGTLLQRSIDIGYDGFMLDFGEYVPEDAAMADGTVGWQAHDAFPVAQHKAAFDYMSKAKPGDYMFYVRSGFTGMQSYATVQWSGDADASFDHTTGLPGQVRAGINAGLSGIPYWGSDISGYTCENNPPPGKELFLRWVEFGALSPIMSEETACSGAMAGPKWTLWSDAQTTQVYAQYALLHTRLFPYLYAAAKEAAQTGVPIMRHPFLEAPTEAAAYGADYQYFFGPSLYVAPVVTEGATTRALWLPPGRWVDWFTLDPLSSGDVTRSASLESLPLFLLSGGIVAMLDPSIQTLAPATNTTVVTVADVQDVLDLRAAIDTATQTGSASLTDGTQLTVTLGAGPVALPAGITTAPDEATVATCSGCGLIQKLASGVTRVQITTPSETSGKLSAGGLTLLHSGSAAKRFRWDVAVLP